MDGQELEYSGTLTSSLVSIVKTIVGVGMLAIPLSLKTDAVGLGLFMIVIAGGLTSGFGLYLQGLSSKFIKRGEANFFNICSITNPSLSLIFDIAIAVQCFGVGLSYIVLIGDLMPTVVTLGFVNDERLFWILVSGLIIGPLVFLKKLDSLKYSSLVGLAAIAYMTILVYSHFFIELGHMIEGHPSPDKGKINWIVPESFTGVLSTFSIIVFAFTGHQNMYSVINELKDNRLQTVNKITFTAIPITAILFITIGLSGYFTFGSNVTGNIILIYHDNVFTMIGRFAIVAMVLLSFPLMFHPCRISINNIVFWFENAWEAFQNHRHQRTSSVGGDEEVHLINDSEPITKPNRPQLTNKRFYILTTLIIIASYVFAIFLTSFEFILAIVGATGSTAISFILPGLFGYKLFDSAESKQILQIMNENGHYEDEADFAYIEKTYNSPFLKKMSLALTIWGCLVMVLCLYSSLYLA